MQTPTHRPRRRTRRTAVAALVGAALLLVPVAALGAASPPTAVTSPADPTLITDTYALLSGVVNPNGTASNYQFQWGTTTAYGQFTPTTPAGNGSAEVPVDASLDGLRPNTTYHYRLAVASTDPAHPGTSFGDDQTFTTAPSLAISLTGGRKAVRANHVILTVSSVGPDGDAAHGRITLRTRIGGRLRNAGSAGYSVAVGKSKTVSIYLPPAAQKALKSASGRKLKASAIGTVAGSKTLATSKLTLVG